MAWQDEVYFTHKSKGMKQRVRPARTMQALDEICPGGVSSGKMPQLQIKFNFNCISSKALSDFVTLPERQKLLKFDF